MRILYYFADYSSAMYNWQHYHIIDELNHHNCIIEIFDLTKYEKIDEANEELILKLKSGNYDLFMTDQRKTTLFIETVQFIKRLGTPRVLIHFDNLMEPFRHVGYAEYFDVVMLLNKDDNHIYKKYKTKCVVAPYAANPYFFKNLRKEDEMVNKVCFAGTPYGTRCVPINILLKNQLEVDLFANKNFISKRVVAGASISNKQKFSIFFEKIKFRTGRKIILGAIASRIKKKERLLVDSEFLKVRPAVTLLEMNNLYSNYSLAISMPEARNTGFLKNPVDIVHLRNFEIPMCAGLQITRYVPELAEYFEEDKEIIFYKSPDELVDKVKFYTNPVNLKLVNQIKLQARKRAENEHTWYNRFKKVFREIGLDI